MFRSDTDVVMMLIHLGVYTDIQIKLQLCKVSGTVKQTDTFTPESVTGKWSKEKGLMIYFVVGKKLR